MSTDQNPKSEQSYPNVTIIVPVLNVAQTIDRCLDSLRHQDYPSGRTEIITIDGGSTDETTSVIAGYPAKLLSLKSNAPTAINYASRLATGEILLFADGDAYYPPDWITSHLENLANATTVASGGPCLTWKTNGFLAELIGYELESRYLHLPSSVPRLSTMNLAIRKDVFQRVGSFDEKLDVAYDTELGYRLLSHGFLIKVTPRALAYHAHRSDLRSYLHQQFRYGRYLPVVIQMHPQILRGDTVTSFWMNAQPVLLGTMFFTALLGFVSPFMWVVAFTLATGVVLTVMAELIRIVLTVQKPRALAAFALLVARIFAWTYGGAVFLSDRLRTRFSGQPERA